MGLIKNIYEGMKYAFAEDKKGFVIPLNYAEKNPQSSFSTYSQYLSASKEISWVYKCCSIIGEGIALTDGYVYDKDDNVMNDTILDQLLVQPNDFMSWFEMKEAITWYLLLTGNCFMLKDEVNGLGQPNKLWLLRPDRMEVIPSTTEFIAGYYYNVGGQRYPFKKEDIIQIKLPNPLNAFLGMGKIEACRMTYDIEKASNRYNWNFFANGASPSAILSNEGKLDEDSFQRLVSVFESRHQGITKMQKPLFLEQGTKYQQMGLSQTDMAFIEQRKFSREEILSIFGVPPAKAGILEYASFANTKEQEGTYRKDTLMPLLKRIQQKLTTELIMKFNPAWRLEFENVVLRDEQAFMTLATQGVTGGILTPNEARELYLELPVVKDEPSMDEYYMGFSLAPITGNPEPTTPPISQNPTQQTPAVTPEPTPTTPEDEEPQGSASLTPIHGKGICDCKAVDTPPEGEITPAQARRKMSRLQLALFKISVETRKKLGVRVKKTSKTFFEGQHQRVMSVLERTVKQAEYDKKDLKLIRWDDVFDSEDELKAFQKAMISAEMPIVVSAVENTLDVLGGELPENFLDRPEVAKMIGRLAERVTGVYNTTIDELDQTLNEGISAGESIAELATRVDYVYEKAEGYRSVMIARTESAFAYDRGAIFGYKELGIGTVDVVGCTMFEPDSDCGAQDVGVDSADALEFHPNHIGTVVPSPSEME